MTGAQLDCSGRRCRWCAGVPPSVASGPPRHRRPSPRSSSGGGASPAARSSSRSPGAPRGYSRRASHPGHQPSASAAARLRRALHHSVEADHCAIAHAAVSTGEDVALLVAPVSDYAPEAPDAPRHRPAFGRSGVGAKKALGAPTRRMPDRDPFEETVPRRDPAASVVARGNVVARSCVGGWARGEPQREPDRDRHHATSPKNHSRQSSTRTITHSPRRTTSTTSE